MRLGPSPEQQSLVGIVEAALSRAGLPAIMTEARQPDALAAEFTRLQEEIGFLGLAVEPSLGGAGGSVADLCLAAEAFGRFAAPMHLIESALAAWATSQLPGGSELASQLAAGEQTGAVAWAGSDVALNDDGTLSGSVDLVPAKGKLDVAIVLTAFGVGVVQTRQAAVSFRSLGSLAPGRPFGTVRLDGCPPLLLDPRPAVARWFRAAVHVLAAADAIGGAIHCLEATLQQARSRQQFGRPIGAFQVVQHQLAEMAVRARPPRGITLAAAERVAAGDPGSWTLAAMARNQAAEAYVTVARQAVELHGAYGFTWDCPLHLYVRRSLVDRSMGGTPDALRDELARNDAPTPDGIAEDWPYPFLLGVSL